MVKRIVLAVLLTMLVVPLLPSGVRQALGLRGITGLIVVLLGLLVVEYLAGVAGSLRAPRVKGHRARKRRNVEHDPADFPPQHTAPPVPQPPVSGESRRAWGEAQPETMPIVQPRPARRPPRLSGGPR